MTKESTHVELTAAWYKKPRRTRNRIMNELSDKAQNTRSLGSFTYRWYDRVVRLRCRDGLISNEVGNLVFHFMDSWVPPPKSYDKRG